MADLNGKKILIVEDNKMIRRQLFGMLSKYGAHVLQACDGQEGYGLAIEELPDIILMDVQMPLMDGYESTTRIRANDLSKRIPVIMLTGNREKDDIQKGENCGATLYLTKPVPGAKILAAILNLV